MIYAMGEARCHAQGMIMRRHPSARRRAKAPKPAGQLPKNAPPISLTISHIGSRGDGVGQSSYTHNYEEAMHAVFVPFTLPGEQVIVQPKRLTKQGIFAELVELETAAPERQDGPCAVYGQCGGCQLGHMSQDAYEDWQIEMVRHVIERAGVSVGEWRPPYFSQRQTRRRARLAFRVTSSAVILGFREKDSHQITAPTGCVILHDDIIALLPGLEAMIGRLPAGAHGECEVTVTPRGCDVTLTLAEEVKGDVVAVLSEGAVGLPILRLHIGVAGAPLTLALAHEPPVIPWALPHDDRRSISLSIPTNSFLQAVPEAEQVMQQDVYEAVGDQMRIADLFCGVGTLSAPLLFRPHMPEMIAGYDLGAEAVDAFQQIADKAGCGDRLQTKTRNLFEAPLTRAECDQFDAVILDPPRAGAQAQVQILSESDVPVVVMASCNPHSFARDAAHLIAGGYRCDWVRVVDQFIMSPHVELVARLSKAAD